MKTKSQLLTQSQRIKDLQNDYFQKVKVYRLALTQPSVFNQKTLLMLLNNAEVSYKRVGFDFGDEDEKGYP